MLAGCGGAAAVDSPAATGRRVASPSSEVVFALRALAVGRSGPAAHARPGPELSAAYGVADLRQRDDRLTGLLSAWGLAPHARYTAYLVSSRPACTLSRHRATVTARILLVLTANAGGIAMARVNAATDTAAGARQGIVIRQGPEPAHRHSHRDQSRAASPPGDPPSARDIALCGDEQTAGQSRPAVATRPVRGSRSGTSSRAAHRPADHAPRRGRH